jgi:hypothetical protein
MLASFVEELGDVEFTLLYQFQDRSLRLAFRENVRDLPIVIPTPEAVGMAAFSAAKVGRLSLERLLGPTARQIMDAYERADLVVSAPAAPTSATFIETTNSSTGSTYGSRRSIRSRSSSMPPVQGRSKRPG